MTALVNLARLYYDIGDYHRAQAYASRALERQPSHAGAQALKEAMLKGLDSSLTEGLQLEAGLEAYLFTTEDAQEAQKAFLEKRKPEFKGK